MGTGQSTQIYSVKVTERTFRIFLPLTHFSR